MPAAAGPPLAHTRGSNVIFVSIRDAPLRPISNRHAFSTSKRSGGGNRSRPMSEAPGLGVGGTARGVKGDVFGLLPHADST